MGLSSLLGMLESVDMGILAVDAALNWHLAQNHYPPLAPSEFYQPAMEAILRVAEGRENAQIRLPDGCTYHGANAAPALTAMDEWHLWPFMDYACALRESGSAAA